MTTTTTTLVKEYALPNVSMKLSPLMRGVMGASASLVGSAVLCIGTASYDWAPVAVALGILVLGIVGLYFGATLLSRGRDTLTFGEKFLAGASVVGGTLSVGTVGLIAFALALMMVIAER